MRKQERTLRALIREMSWGAPDDDDPRSGDLGYVSGIGNPDYDKFGQFNDMEQGKKFAKNLSRSSGWAKKAKQLYGNVPFPIWTIAYIGSLTRDFRMLARGKMMDLGEGLEQLQAWKEQYPENFAELNLNKLSGVGSGDLVIFYATELESNLDFNATSWKVFHAIFDSEIAPRHLETWGALEGAFWALFDHFADQTAQVLANAFTMGMARFGRKRGLEDDVGELVYDAAAQEVIDSRGFHLNEEYLETLDEEGQEVLLNLIPFVRAVGDEFREKARGKFIMVDVDTAQ